jgi:hypothetical protein
MQADWLFPPRLLLQESVEVLRLEDGREACGMRADN